MVLEKCGVMFTGQTRLSKGNFPFNLGNTLSILQFPFCTINMATLNDAFHAIEQKRLLFRP